MNETHLNYASYLLRLWQIQANGDKVWRASLECSQTGQRWAFANLDDLLSFLYRQTSELSIDPEGDENL